MARNKITIGDVTELLNDARLPASLGTAGQVLKMNSDASAIEWGTDNVGSTVSGVDDGTNWTSITINGTTMLIPAGGGGSDIHLYCHTINIWGSCSAAGYARFIGTTNVILTTPTPQTIDQLIAYLQNAGLNDTSHAYPFNGILSNTASSPTVQKHVQGIIATNSGYNLGACYFESGRYDWALASGYPELYTKVIQIV